MCLNAKCLKLHAWVQKISYLVFAYSKPYVNKILCWKNHCNVSRGEPQDKQEEHVFGTDAH